MPAWFLPCPLVFYLPCPLGFYQNALGMVNGKFSMGMAKFAVGIGEVPRETLPCPRQNIPCPRTTLQCPQKTLPKCPSVSFSVGMEKSYVGMAKFAVVRDFPICPGRGPGQVVPGDGLSRGPPPPPRTLSRGLPRRKNLGKIGRFKNKCVLVIR